LARFSTNQAENLPDLFDFSVLDDPPPRPSQPATIGAPGRFRILAVVDPAYPAPALDPWLSASQRAQILDDIAWFDRIGARLQEQL